MLLINKIKNAIKNKQGLLGALKFIILNPFKTIKYLFSSGEQVSNFYYDIDYNDPQMIDFLIKITGNNKEEINAFIKEFFEDIEFKQEILLKLSTTSFREEKLLPGRRILWYVIVRSLKPNLVIETGCHDGLGSSVILLALLKNQLDGKLITIDLPSPSLPADISDTSGWLIPMYLKKNHELLINSSREELPRISNLNLIDFFIHDSLHTYENECFEFETVIPKMRNGGIILTDNGHNPAAFNFICNKFDLTAIDYKEKVINHSYPGATTSAAKIEK